MFYPLEGTSDPSTDIALLAAASQPTAVRNIERERAHQLSLHRRSVCGCWPGKTGSRPANTSICGFDTFPFRMRPFAWGSNAKKRHIHKNVSARNTAHWPSFSSRHKQSTGLGNITGYSPPDGKQFAITETQRNATFQWKLFAKMLPAKTQNNCPT